MSNKILKEGLTYDDVLVVPAYSEVLPHMVSTATKFTKNINLNIPKGSVVGFMGPTGSGKSTLIDIILGLLQPSKGIMYIDDKVIKIKSRNTW